MLEGSEGIHYRASSARVEQIKHLNKFKDQYSKNKQLKTQSEQLIIQSEQLKTQALTDSLTGIWNRRALLGDGDTGKIEGGHSVPHLTREIAEARRSKSPLTVLMFDIDNFKNVNDNPTLGHAGGDAVLQSLTQLLNKNIRTADIFGRIGGEEFLIILSETNQTNAIGEAERLRKLVEANQTVFNGKKIKITISVGVAELNNFHKELKDLVSKSDTNMHKAKNTGRNRVFPQLNVDSNLLK